MFQCFKCGCIEPYVEPRISHISTMILDKNKYICKKYSCFKCSPEYMIRVKSSILKNKEFEIKKCEICGDNTVKDTGTLSPYLGYQNNNYIICCKCIFN